MLSRELQGLTLWDRHKWLVDTYQASPAQGSVPSIRTDLDVLREHHQFIRDDGGSVAPDAPWEERLAAKYYQTVIKEYAVVDLNRYRDMKVGLRWRTEPEVITGKGQFECASLSCTERFGLKSFEVPFSYKEQGGSKQALVKVRVCEECTPKLYWKKTKELKKLAKVVAAHATDAASPAAAPATAESARTGEEAAEQVTADPARPHRRAPEGGSARQKRDRSQSCPDDHSGGITSSDKHTVALRRDEPSKTQRPAVRAVEGETQSDDSRRRKLDEAEKLIQELLM